MKFAATNQKHYPGLGSDASFRGETVGGVAKCRLFSKATIKLKEAALNLCHTHLVLFSIEDNIITMLTNGRQMDKKKLTKI